MREKNTKMSIRFPHSGTQGLNFQQNSKTITFSKKYIFKKMAGMKTQNKKSYRTPSSQSVFQIKDIFLLPLNDKIFNGISNYFKFYLFSILVN